MTPKQTKGGIDMTFPERLKALRHQKKISRAEMAAQLEMSASAYTHYETGRAEPPLKKLVKLAEILNVSTDYLLSGIEGAAPADLSKYIDLAAAAGYTVTPSSDGEKVTISFKRTDISYSATYATANFIDLLQGLIDDWKSENAGRLYEYIDGAILGYITATAAPKDLPTLQKIFIDTRNSYLKK